MREGTRDGEGEDEKKKRNKKSVRHREKRNIYL